MLALRNKFLYDSSIYHVRKNEEKKGSVLWNSIWDLH